MYKFILSFRYMYKRRISYLAFLAVALCVFIVVIVMTVLKGLVGDFKQKNHNFIGDCVVGTESLVGFPYYEDFIEVLEGQDFIEAVSSVIKSYALISPRGSNYHKGVELIGIDPVKHGRATEFGKSLFYNHDNISESFVPAYEPNLPGCVPGIDLVLMRDSRGKYYQPDRPLMLAWSISSFPLTPKGALAKAGLGMVNTKSYYYSDNSHSGLARVDGNVFYIRFSEAQTLCGMDTPIKRASWIHIKFDDNTDLLHGCGRVKSLWQQYMLTKIDEPGADLLSNVVVRSWKEHHRGFIAAMEKEQAMMTVMFILVGFTTVFIVFVVFYMIISHKSKDIGVLRSIGVSGSEIIYLFSFFAFLILLFCSLVSTFFGWLFLSKINEIESWLFEHLEFQLWDRAIYAIGEIPNNLDLSTLIVIVISAIVACLLGAILPSWQGSKLNPIESLQVSQL
jgi:lipoprotein-releasing system permease protein